MFGTQKKAGIRRDKTMPLMWGIFAGLGLFLVLLGLYLGLSPIYGKDRGKTTALIEEMSEEHTWVSYEVDGQRYGARIDGHSSGFYPGKEITIRYDKEDPAAVVADDLLILYFLPCMIGTVFLLLGGIGLVVIGAGRKREARLRESGRRVYAEYVETRVNYSVSVNGRHPRRVICRWYDPGEGKEYLMKSGNLWGDVENLVESGRFSQIPVYVDREDPRRYFVDMESLNSGNLVDLT